VLDEAGAEACPECNRRVAHFLYDPFGEMASSWIDPTFDASKLDRLFTNQRYDADLGLYDYRARFYDPLVGQFIQPDSIVPDPLNPLAWNRFGYVYNNAVNYTDPSGHIPWDVTIDVASFGWSLYDFIQNPTWANFGWLALDAVGLLPLIPSIGAVRHAGKLGRADNMADIARFADCPITCIIRPKPIGDSG